jgi:hypothetical protein
MKLEELTNIIVGGLTIEVNSPNHDLINNGLLGHYLPANLEIGIRDDLPDQLQGNVLVHEVTHAIANVYCEGLNLDEAQIASIAQGFYQVLTDNEDLVHFIMHSSGEVYNCVECDQLDLDDLYVDHRQNGHLDRGDKIVRALANTQADSQESIVLGQA